MLGAMSPWQTADDNARATDPLQAHLVKFLKEDAGLLGADLCSPGAYHQDTIWHPFRLIFLGISHRRSVRVEEIPSNAEVRL